MARWSGCLARNVNRALPSEGAVMVIASMIRLSAVSWEENTSQIAHLEQAASIQDPRTPCFVVWLDVDRLALVIP